MVVFVIYTFLYRIDIFMRLSRLLFVTILQTSVQTTCRLVKFVFFYDIYYVDCQLDTILCLDLVFGMLFIVSVKPQIVEFVSQGRKSMFKHGGEYIHPACGMYCAARSAAPCSGGSGAYALPRKFLKWCNLVSFGVYLNQILSSKNFKNYYFLYKNLINYHFFL